MAIIGYSTALIFSDEFVGTKVVNCDSLDLKIPANFEYNSTASENVTGDITAKKVWNRGDEKIEILVVGNGVENNNLDSKLKSIGEGRKVRYGITGFYNQFQEGGEAFSFSKNNKIYSIIVSDEKLFDKIEMI